MLFTTANVVRATIRTYRLKQQGRVGSSLTVSPYAAPAAPSAPGDGHKHMGRHDRRRARRPSGAAEGSACERMARRHRTAFSLPTPAETPWLSFAWTWTMTLRCVQINTPNTIRRLLFNNGIYLPTWRLLLSRLRVQI